MKKIANLFYQPKYMVIWVVCITLWTFLFPIIYKPTFGYRYETIWNDDATLRISILAAIVFGVTVGSRLILYFTTRHIGLLETHKLSKPCISGYHQEKFATF